jgi:hypothetical protein
MNTIPELSEYASKYDLGLCKVYNRPVVIEARGQSDGTRKWVLKMDGYVMTHYGCFVWEPLPSSRSDRFILLTRFNSADECYKFWLQQITEIRELYENVDDIKYHKKV